MRERADGGVISPFPRRTPHWSVPVAVSAAR